MTEPIEVLYFYRTKWGAHDEFMRLFRKNHWPILREQLGEGRFTDVHLATPRFHGDGRADWDIIVSITYRDWASIEEHSEADKAAFEQTMSRLRQLTLEAVVAGFQRAANEVITRSLSGSSRD